MQILFVTSNKGKVRNAREALRKYNVSVRQFNMNLVESRSENPSIIAQEKAKQAFRLLRKPVMVEDSGFFIKALGGFPKTHVRFSLATLGVENILQMLKGKKDRWAEWKMTVAFADVSGRCKLFTFREHGEIASTLRPKKRPVMSDYWRIYIPKMKKENRLALCEMSGSELLEWQKYYATHNQFMKLGRWIAGQQAKKSRSRNVGRVRVSLRAES